TSSLHHRSRTCSAGRVRNTLLHYYRKGADPELRLRAHVVLLLADGVAWLTIAALLYTSSSTIARWRARFRAGGLPTLLRPPPRRAVAAGWAALVVGWALTRCPADFGFARSRWSCQALAVALEEDYTVRVSRETVRRWLRQAGLVWR